MTRLSRLFRMIWPLALPFAIGAVMGRAATDDGIDWQTAQVDHALSVDRRVPVTELAAGAWTQACIFLPFEDWAGTPGSHRGSPPGFYAIGFGTIRLADAGGHTAILRLPHVRRAAGVEPCVSVDTRSRLVAVPAEGVEWALHFE